MMICENSFLMDLNQLECITIKSKMGGFYKADCVVLIDKELRLKALSMLYQNDMEGKPTPGTINDLQGMTLDEYRRASLYLIKHHLAEGHSTSTRGGYSSWASHVTGTGMDVIEKLIDKSIQQVEEKKITFASKTLSYAQQFSELTIIWSKNTDLMIQAWDYLVQLIGS